MRWITEVDDARFGQDILNILINLCNQFYTVLRYSLRGGQVGLEAISTRFVVSFALFKLNIKNIKEAYIYYVILT